MTRVGSDRILKYANGNISDHIHNHIHLTNCIHLKNHMHRHSPMLGDNSLMRDLVVLQRSRSLRDPSASPPSWHSPLDADMTLKHVEKDAVVCDGTKSVAVERPRNGRRLSGGSPCIAVLSSSKVAPGEIIGGAAVSHLSTKSRLRGGKKINREASGSKSIGGDSLGGSEVPPVSVNQEDNELPPDAVSKNHVPKDKMSRQKARHRQDNLLKTLSEQLKDAPMDSDGVVSSHVHLHGRHNRKERTVEDPETSSRRSLSGLNRVNKRRMRGAKRTGASVSLRDVGAHSEFSVASNSLAQGSEHQRYQLEEGEGNFAEQCVTRASKNSCGIPWNWSRIHHRGRTILDIAGRSFSCGTSDSRSKKGGLVPRQKDVLNIPTESDGSSSYAKSEAEALPLLVEASGSQVSSDNAVWARDYSGGEIGIFAERLLNPDNASDVASEARFIERVKFRGHRHGRHRSLTQKYMPRTFTDLVGQNLVAQALTNAIVKRKVGLLYVFYGPHGTGKTSCARIFARALNCQSLDHLKPCGLCNSCTAQNTGKSSSIREVGPVSNFDMETIMDLLDNMSVSVSQRPLQFRVMIFDDCDSLTPDCWSSISKVIDRAPRRVVFVLVSSSLDHLPHMIISRCQKFFFPKLKDADITYTLQWISTKESLEIDKDALKLIASRSDGSLRDAEMTLEQLSLLGQRISVPLVQELVGLICDEKLVDLLDLALSADTVNTVKNLREIMETSVDPLALMSQLATVITDILAGSYDFNKERFRRKFFRRPTLSKEDMEKLRQALKTLSEAEKQLRMSNDKLTWLTAALLQLAPDQQYMLPSSFVDPTFNHSPSALNNVGGRDASRRSSAHHEDMPNNERALSSPNEIYNNGKMRGTGRDGKMPSGAVSFSPQMSTLNPDMNRLRNQQMSGKIREEIEEIWLEVLRRIQSDNIREFICNEGKLGSVRFDGAPTTVQLMFDSHMNKAKAEEFQGDILQAFESVLESPVVLEIRCEVGKDKRLGANVPPVLPSTDNSSSQMVMRSVGYNGINKWALKRRDANGAGATPSHTLNSDVVGIRSEIVEIAASPRELKCSEPVDNTVRSHLRSSVSSWPRETAGSSYKKSATVSHRGRKVTDINRSHSLVRGKVSLAHVLQQAEGRTRNGWSKRKAVSIAEKLEQENLRLEPSSRCLGCWKASRVTRQKLSRLKFRMRPRSLLKFVSCGRSLSSKSRR